MNAKKQFLYSAVPEERVLNRSLFGDSTIKSKLRCSALISQSVANVREKRGVVCLTCDRGVSLLEKSILFMHFYLIATHATTTVA